MKPLGYLLYLHPIIFNNKMARCPLAQMTLKDFIEDTIKKNVPEIKEVDAIWME